MGAFARAVLALTLAAAAPSTAAGARGSPSRSSPPCATCLTIILRPEQLDLLPAALNGLDVLVDVQPAAADVPELLERIRARGGRAGVRLPGLDAMAHVPGLSSTSTVVLDVGTVGQPLDRLVFALRTAATSIRATAATPPRIVVEAPSMVRGELQRLAAQGYWDAVLDAAGAGWQSGGVLTGAVAALRAAQAHPGRLVLTAGSDDGQTRQTLADLALAVRWLDDSLVPDDGGVTGRVRRRRPCSRLSRSRLTRSRRSARGVCSRPAGRLRANAPGRADSTRRGRSTRPDGRAGCGSFRRRRRKSRHPGA